MSVREGLGHLRGEVRWVDVTDTDAVLAACENADVLWLASPTNPLLGIADLPRLCAFARERAILCVVDNTFGTPLLQRPLALGADVASTAPPRPSAATRTCYSARPSPPTLAG